ncbi:aspartate--tRNA ligase, partial [Candidatus Peregrinibacteria bacterium]|nr:aspartate--tRNA ligase [Candidatus Peregrinibacteria bacterium]
ADYTRKEIDDLTELAKVHGAKGLAYIQMASEGAKSPILKFLSESELKSVIEKTGAKTGDIIFFGADKFETACESLGQVRLACADKQNLRNNDELAFCWITDFPLFEWDDDESRLAAVHHPFTSPNYDDIPKLDSKPEDVRSIAYDLAMNGSEIAGGSIRIHDPELQSKIFELLGITKEDAEKRFGHLLEAFKYGTPPHGGIAWGFDRFVMILQDEPNIREVMAFPKDQKAKDLMLSAPSSLPAEQVAEANIKIIEKK